MFHRCVRTHDLPSLSIRARAGNEKLANSDTRSRERWRAMRTAAVRVTERYWAGGTGWRAGSASPPGPCRPGGGEGRWALLGFRERQNGTRFHTTLWPRSGQAVQAGVQAETQAGLCSRSGLCNHRRGNLRTCQSADGPQKPTSLRGRCGNMH